jgi:hypothetical protein
MEMLRFIASVAYRNPGMAASGMLSQRGNRPKLAGSCGPRRVPATTLLCLRSTPSGRWRAAGLGDPRFHAMKRGMVDSVFQPGTGLAVSSRNASGRM